MTAEAASSLRADITAAVDAVLAPAFLQQLDRLRLKARATRGQREGENLMRRTAQASGIELESHRAYAPGDDPRRIDWNAYGRLDQLVVRLYRAEREVPHYFLIDASASMAYPPSDRKLPFAAALVLSLAYTAVRNHDPVHAVRIGGDLERGFAAAPRIRHLEQLIGLREFLAASSASGKATLAAGLHGWLQTRPVPGMAVILSDFLQPPDDCEQALEQLGARGFDVACVRLLGEAERDPTRIFRAGRIVDAETGREREVRLDAKNLERYRLALERHTNELNRLCARHQTIFAVADSGGVPDAAVLRLIRGMP